MNETINSILTRHAIRRFQPRQIEREELDQILTAGLYAPSAGNNQYSRIVVSQNAEVNEQLGRLSRAMFYKNGEPDKPRGSVSDDQPSIIDDLSIKSSFYGAPTVLTIFTRSGGIYSHDDGALIAGNIMIAANSLGIGSCYIGRTDEVFATEYGMAMRKKWGVPEDMTAVCNVLLGYREGPAPHDKPRREGRIIFAD